MSLKLLTFTFLLVLISTQGYGSSLFDPFFTGGSACCDKNKIVVSGSGVASGLPDIAKVTVGFDISATTSEAAVNELTLKIRRAITTILEYGLDQSSYKTQNFYVRANYQYLNGKSQIVGYTASQYLEVTVNNLDAQGKRVSTLIDHLASIDKIQFQGISFDIKDKTDLQTLARERAFQDAKLKAQDYAEFSGQRVGRVLIVDDYVRVEAAPQPEFKAVAYSVAADSRTPTNIQVGELDVNYQVTVTFRLSL